MLERLFHLQESGTNVKREVIAGCTTFMTLSYIIFVQPALLADANGAGMDPDAVMVATCISSALAMILMAFLTNYPIALAPAMGLNVYFTFTVCGVLGVSWQHALGAVFLSGILFTLLSTVGLRETVMNALPVSLRNAIAIGIGLFIALIGLEWAGLVAGDPITYVKLGNLRSAPALLSIFGLAVTGILFGLKVRGAILIGILASTIAALITGVVDYQGIVSAPPSIAPTFLKLQFPNIVAEPHLITIIFVFIFIDMFDTVGTLVGVSQQAGLMVDGRLPKARRALLTDAIATSAGALVGTSTVTSYVESASGISAGGRTGLTNIVTAALMLLAVFFNPLMKMVGAGFPVEGGVILRPIVAPALVLIGCMMIKNVIHIDWDDMTEAVPAFLTLIMMPLAYSITEGIAFGFISYALLKLASGRGKEVHWLIYLFALLFVARYVWLVG